MTRFFSLVGESVCPGAGTVRFIGQAALYNIGVKGKVHCEGPHCAVATRFERVCRFSRK